jgi:2,5-diamino-6-(ribosylamino)-4(3H)-pyrimidinone 5'-phosphate reductase
MRPKIILHTAVSADGRIDWFTPDIGLFYRLVGRWHEDATLAGSETILRALAEEPAAAEEGDAAPPEPRGDDSRPLLVIPDSRGRVRSWPFLRRQPHWRDTVALCSRATPADHLDFLRRHHVHQIVAGEDHVDLPAALEELAERFGVRTVRVDSGGTLSGLLLRAGLVDEVSILLHPCLVGGSSPRSFYRAPDLTGPEGVLPLRLTHLEKLSGDVVWLIYEVVR